MTDPKSLEELKAEMDAAGAAYKAAADAGLAACKATDGAALEAQENSND